MQNNERGGLLRTSQSIKEIKEKEDEEENVEGDLRKSEHKLRGR